MFLRQTFSKPINGYWGGGAKSIFDWTIQGSPATDSKGEYVKIGSFSANHWFHVALGKTSKVTLSYAKAHLKALAKRRNLECTFQYIDN